MTDNTETERLCTLMGCARPALPGRHHHFYRGHLDTYACRCAQGGEPGTRPDSPVASRKDPK